MINVALCDDNPLHLNDIKEKVQHILGRTEPDFELSTFTSAEDLLDSIENGAKPQIAVLDIELEGENGISLAKKLNKRLPECRIIFLTNYPKYASEVYETRHTWFVIKKQADLYLESAITKALNSVADDDPAVLGILVRENGKTVLVPLKEILYIGKVGRKAHVHCIDRDYYDSRNPSHLIPDTLADHFLRCHQGYWVNFRMIEELDHEELVLSGGLRIPISRTFRDSVRQTFFSRYHLN